MRCKSKDWSQKPLHSYTLLTLSSSNQGFLLSSHWDKKGADDILEAHAFLRHTQLTPQRRLLEDPSHNLNPSS